MASNCGSIKFTWTAFENGGQIVAQFALHENPLKIELKLWLKSVYMDTLQKWESNCGSIGFTQIRGEIVAQIGSLEHHLKMGVKLWLNMAQLGLSHIFAKIFRERPCK